MLFIVFAFHMHANEYIHACSIFIYYPTSMIFINTETGHLPTRATNRPLTAVWQLLHAVRLAICAGVSLEGAGVTRRGRGARENSNDAWGKPVLRGFLRG